MWEKFYQLIFNFAYPSEEVRKVYPIRQEFLIDSAIQNLNSLYEIMILLEIIEIVLLILPATAYNYKPASLTFTIMNAIFIVCLDFVRRKAFKFSYHLLNALQIGIVLNFILLGTLMNLLSQNSFDFIHLYIVAITFVATGVHLSASVLSLITLFSGAINAFGIFLLQKNVDIMSPQIVNIVVFVMLAWYLGILVNRTRITIWLKQRQEIENIELLEDLNRRDSMTRFFNHESILLHLKTAMEHSRKSQEILSILILDLDDFKKINDTYGHLEGDAVLLEVAKIIRNEVRSLDIIGRYGGEEFLIIFPNTHQTQAYGVAERIRTKVASLAVDHGHVTLSGGLATYHNESFDELVKLADNRMYQAKGKGKNQIQM